MEDKLKLYQQGFNSGYLISKHAPELAKLIAESPGSESEYFQGFLHGSQEHDLEKINERFSIPSQNPTSSKDRDKDIEMEK